MQITPFPCSFCFVLSVEDFNSNIREIGSFFCQIEKLNEGWKIWTNSWDMVNFLEDKFETKIVMEKVVDLS